MSKKILDVEQDVSTVEDIIITAPMEKPAVNVLMIVVTVISLLLALGAFFLSLNFYRFVQNINEKHRVDITNIDRNLQNIQNTLLTQQQQIKEVSEIANRHEEQQMVMSEVGYLLRLTDYNLQYTHNPQIALQILTQIRQRISLLDDPGIANFKQAVDQNIAELNNIPKVDLAVVMLNIEGLDNQVDNLPLMKQKTVFQASSSKEKANPEASRWKKAWHSCWQKLSKIIIIRRHDQPIEPLLSEQQQLYIKQNLHLLLAQMSFAVQSCQQQNFANELTKTQQWINKYYATNEKEVDNFSKTLDNLKTININPKLPDLAKTMQAYEGIELSTNTKEVSAPASATNNATTKPKLMPKQNQSHKTVPPQIDKPLPIKEAHLV